VPARMPRFSSGTFQWKHICTGRELPMPPTLQGHHPKVLPLSALDLLFSNSAEVLSSAYASG
jgi:hypothetical protein